MVRQATETAVSASISTPVWPATLAFARMRRPGRVASASMSTKMDERESGWQSGISSCVRLAAMIPAMRAAPTTSPFLALPETISASVAAFIVTAPSAIAVRSVAVLAPTSTMRAAPVLSRWVRRRTMRLSRRRAGPGGQQAPGGRRHIRLTHQAFADEIGADAGLAQPGNIRGGEDAALADQQAIARHQRGQPLAHRERGDERMQVAIVDADEPRAQPESARQLGFVVHLKQHVHAKRDRRILERMRLIVGNAGHDDEDAVGAEGAGLIDLIGLVKDCLLY